MPGIFLLVLQTTVKPRNISPLQPHCPLGGDRSFRNNTFYTYNNRRTCRLATPHTKSGISFADGADAGGSTRCWWTIHLVAAALCGLSGWLSVFRWTFPVFYTFKDGKAAAYPMGDYFFWHQGKDLFFKEQFNDTIYQVTADALLPVRRFDFGKYRWESADRYDPEKDHAIYPTEMMEGNDIYFIRFATDIHTERMVYNAIYNKKNGLVKVSNYHSAIENDLNGFLPLQPKSVSPDGEFAQIVSADQIVSWFEENTDKTDIPTEIAALKQVGEEDNPVVVIME